MEITGAVLKTFVDAGQARWSLACWLVPEGRRVSCGDVIAIAECEDWSCEIEVFDEGFLIHRLAEGQPIALETSIAMIVEPEDMVPLEFALKRIHEGEPCDFDLLKSAVTLCESADVIDNSHLLRCLDYGGSVAAWGARGLYAKTGRDGIGRFTISTAFSTDRSGWENYLSTMSGGENVPSAADS